MLLVGAVIVAVAAIIMFEFFIDTPDDSMIVWMNFCYMAFYVVDVILVLMQRKKNYTNVVE